MYYVDSTIMHHFQASPLTPQKLTNPPPPSLRALVRPHARRVSAVQPLNRVCQSRTVTLVSYVCERVEVRFEAEEDRAF